MFIITLQVWLTVSILLFNEIWEVLHFNRRESRYIDTTIETEKLQNVFIERVFYMYALCRTWSESLFGAFFTRLSA
jgi:hypothetical protein